jgi:crotonobetainyl-CoA:carnitine CoA-transferase CaiB-like acyl-CoA transferase
LGLATLVLGVTFMLTGNLAAFALMLALRQRDLTGEPQLVDLGLYEPLLRLIEDQIVAFDTTGEAMGAVGNSNPLICPNNLFPTRDGRWVSLPASTEPLWRRLIAVMGAQDLARYDSNRIRIEHRDEIESRVRAWTMRHDMLDLVAVCEAAGLAVGPVYSSAEIVADPHVQARGSVVTIEDEDLGRKVRLASSAGRFSGFEARADKLGPALGEHSEEVLGEELGLDQAQLEALRRDGVI